MDVSKPALTGNASGSGIELFEAVVEESGLPSELATQELSEILGASGVSAESLTLDELRAAMLTYLEAFAPPEGETDEVETPASLALIQA